MTRFLGVLGRACSTRLPAANALIAAHRGPARGGGAPATVVTGADVCLAAHPGAANVISATAGATAGLCVGQPRAVAANDARVLASGGAFATRFAETGARILDEIDG